MSTLQMPTAAILKAPPTAGSSTLRTLRISRLLLLGLDTLLLVAILIGTHVHRDAMQVVGKDAVPSIIAAQRIKAAMADMDGQASNELLGQAGTDSFAARTYEARRIEASRALIAAAENITYGDSERQPIQTLQVGLGTYERLVQRARDLQPASREAAVQAYVDAAHLMDFTLQPAADALDQANNTVLERTFIRRSSESLAARGFVLLAGLALLALLLMTQVFLSRRMRRTLNLPLLAATLLAVGFAGYSLLAMSTEQHKLREAKEDAFASIYALWQGRSTAYQADAEESRFLLYATGERGLVGGADQEFSRDSRALVNPPSGMNPARLLTLLRAGEHVDGFTGLLADELNNITYPGEREASVGAVADWGRFLAVDAELRRLERGGQHQQAVALDLGNTAAESNWSFQQFDEALGNTLQINQQAFDAAVGRGFGALRRLELKACAAAVLLALLIVFGLAPRIREYR